MPSNFPHRSGSLVVLVLTRSEDDARSFKWLVQMEESQERSEFGTSLNSTPPLIFVSHSDYTATSATHYLLLLDTPALFSALDAHAISNLSSPTLPSISISRLTTELDAPSDPPDHPLYLLHFAAPSLGPSHPTFSSHVISHRSLGSSL